MRIWFPIWKCKRWGYNYYTDEMVNLDFVYILSFTFEKILSGISVRFNYSWSPCEQEEHQVKFYGHRCSCYGISSAVKELVNDHLPVLKVKIPWYVRNRVEINRSSVFET